MFWPDRRLKWSTSPCFLPLVFQPFALCFSCARYIRLCAATNLARCCPPPLAQTKQKLGNRGRKWDGPSAGFVWDQNRAMAWLARAPRLKKKKKEGLFLFSFWKLYWLDCVWRLQACAGVAREQVEAQEQRKVCESCLYTKLHESQQHKGETRSVVEDWISAYYSFKTSWDSRLTFIRAIANVDFLHFLHVKELVVYFVLSQVCKNKHSQPVSGKATRIWLANLSAGHWVKTQTA